MLEDPLTLRLATDVMSVASSVLVLLAFAWILIGARGRLGPRLRPVVLMCVFVIALTATHLMDRVESFIPGVSAAPGVGAVMAAVSLAMALAFWALMPRLRAEPTHSELALLAERLRSESELRAASVDELTRLRDDLERRVAARTSDLQIAHRRFEVALLGANIVVTQQDRDLRYLWMYNPPAQIKDVDVIGRLPHEVLPSSVARAQEAVNRRVLATGKAERFELVWPSGEGSTWYEGRVEPLLVGEQVAGLVTVSIDITRHKRHELEIRDVMRELTHRSKNLLAVVQSIARKSATDAADLSDFADAFTSRLQTLSRVHELLVTSGWRGVPLRALLEETHELRGAAELAIAGPDIELTPEAAQNFALAIDELAAEAEPAPVGEPMKISVEWRVADGRLHFAWSRDGGSAKKRVGAFGRALLDDVLPRLASGEASYVRDARQTRYRYAGLAAPLIAQPAGLEAGPDAPYESDAT